jgi:peroxiredoxin
MRRSFGLKLAAVAAALCVLATSSLAAEFNKVVNVGDKAPAWAGATGIDGKQHGLSDYKDAKVVVMVFTCNKCPVAIAYEDRLVALQKDYKAKGVQFVAVNVNDNEADGLPAMKVRAEEKGFNFPYLFDASQESARAYGATVTPHVFVLDQDRKITYMGAVDDNQSPDKVTKHHLRDAIDATLAGTSPAVKETKQFGCGIQYKSKAK